MKTRLVIVDDAPFIVEVVRNAVSADDGIEVVGVASDGEEALQVVEQVQPDVVLMDIVMPKMSGIEAAQRILESWPQVRVIACSTVDQETMVMRALEAGCCHYLTKPFKVEELIKAVKNVEGGFR